VKWGLLFLLGCQRKCCDRYSYFNFKITAWWGIILLLDQREREREREREITIERVLKVDE
jgi:hypothetical protein